MSNLTFRKDHRTTDQFIKDISIRTKREKVLMDLWAERAKKCGIIADVKDTGIDNTGQLVKRATRFPDYCIIDNNNTEKYMEIKVSPVSFATFKRDDLEYFKNFDMPLVWLVFLNTSMFKDDLEPGINTEFFYLTKSKINYIIEKAEYNSTGHNGFGGKPTYKMYRRDIEELFNINKLLK